MTLSIKVVYDDYGGAHSTQVAAAVHLGVLPTDRVPQNSELMALPLFDRTTTDNHGCLIFMGTDNMENDVFILGRGPSATSVERAVASGVALVGGDPGSLRFFDTLPTVNIWMRIGGFLSRALKLTGLGRPLVLYGTRKAFFQIVKFVDQAKETVRMDGEKRGIFASDGCELGAVAGRSVKRGIVPGIQDTPLLQNEDGQSKKE